MAGLFKLGWHSTRALIALNTEVQDLNKNRQKRVKVSENWLSQHSGFNSPQYWVQLLEQSKVATRTNELQPERLRDSSSNLAGMMVNRLPEVCLSP